MNYFYKSKRNVIKNLKNVEKNTQRDYESKWFTLVYSFPSFKKKMLTLF